jgi:hypothetical protein
LLALLCSSLSYAFHVHCSHAQGFGTDERTLIDTLSPLDAFQVDLLSRTFESTTGRSLKVTLEKELSGWYV